MQTILLIFPHQLFRKHPGLAEQPDAIALIEDSLFFRDWHYRLPFHKQKLWLHRASMKHQQSAWQSQGFQVDYLDFDASKNSLQRHLKRLSRRRKTRFLVADPVDFILRKRLIRNVQKLPNVTLQMLPTPGFINDPDLNNTYRAGKKRWFMADYYRWQRKRLGLLMEADGKPTGGQWSFDKENRKKIPKAWLLQIPPLTRPDFQPLDEAAQDHVLREFPEHPGELDTLIYPTTHYQATQWLSRFLQQRFHRFGDFEDAIEQGENWLWHSVLTPMLNIGLLTPQQIMDTTLQFAEQSGDLPINSLEGFIRQIIGWREFMRATYEDLGTTMRTTNHWNHHRPLPSCFYDATTGVLPIDDTIKRVQQTGYCHHIERLMVLGGFMFLCEIDPDAIYRWFMEMFVDSYDWVMVPNVYAMSQHADGGLITTKPYFSGSSYIRKMSHYPNGDWCQIWDGLYWRWIWKHGEALERNPRWAMMCSMLRKMDVSKREHHIQTAEAFLRKLPAASGQSA